MAKILFTLIIVFLVFEFVLNTCLKYLNNRSWDKKVPEEVNGLYDDAKYIKAKNYHQVYYRINQVTSIIGLVLILILLFTESFAYLDGLVRTEFEGKSETTISLFYIGILYLANFIFSIPLDVYKTFVIEEKFGFNKSTVKTFIVDQFKSMLLAIIIGGGILAVISFLFNSMGKDFWWIAWLVVSGFTLFFTMFGASIITPIFNKLKPLEDGTLKESITNYAKKVNFPLKKISVIDGSKRSTKANAYFTGLGSQKSIVLYDTLINESSTEQLTAVLAHEVGHYKKKHILLGLFLSILNTGVLLFLFGWLSSSSILADVLGAGQNSFHLALITFGLLYSPVSLITGLALNMLSRKNEFEADEFATKTYSGKALVEALKKLSINHLSNLTPNALFVFFFHSHPPLVERIQAINKVENRLN